MDYEVYLCVKITADQLKDVSLEQVGDKILNTVEKLGYTDCDWWYEECREEVQ